MSKLRKIRIWITVPSCLCMIALAILFTVGVRNEFTDGLLLAMHIVGETAALGLVFNAVLAVYEYVRERKAGRNGRGQSFQK